ncbi:TetR/AcrR family transcriptional regulator [Actinacidiphila alni]|uniref:TetR/AcrR family transcriptional regulator n=1 Tax=Actinacidiphila alni TaxID=380248 RepID=UPI0033E456AC
METIKGRKDGYHHGDLRNALVGAAIDLATAGGPEAVVLREAARRVGVSPTAAYRHFAGQGDLLFAVKSHGQDALAVAMRAEIAASGAAPGSARAEADPGAAAVERTKAVGRGYLRFAFAEPGMFRTAFCRIAMPMDAETGQPTRDDNDNFSSFDMLSTVLDDLVATGRMSPRRRPGAEVAAWSGVHGLAILVIDGPLAMLRGEALAASVENVLETLVQGLCAQD